jgi:spore coat polysaccharide biosynthesis predicted glycosyltransferase SpsG
MRTDPARTDGARRLLLLCADATPEIGAGHAMRLAALAEAWSALGLGTARLHGEVTIHFVRARLRALGVEMGATPGEDTTGTIALVDSYDERRRAEAARMAEATVRVLVDDDGSAVPAGYHAVWNPNAHGSAALYQGFDGEVIAGEEAIPLRRDLPRWRGPHRRRVAVALGGGAVAPTLRAAMALLEPGVPLAGPGDWVPPAWEHVDSIDPWRTIARSSVLITSAGTSLWEAAAVGIPVVVVRSAANQTDGFRWAVGHGVPGVDALEPGDARALAARIASALPHAARLPLIRGGADAVARRLHALAARELVA